ncbi:TPA: hypothetical protein DCQ44_02590 [Candidatus Taylorbacteria bacterium]|nr:hypothetical protein [Candidatus Taylorbacteria bacterium]
MKKQLMTIGAAAFVGVIALAGTVSADSAVKIDAKIGARVGPRVGLNASSTASSTLMRQALKLDATNTRLQGQADKEITRRLDLLNKMAARIEEMKKVSAAGKASLSTDLQAHVNLLNNLSTKIKADTDAATLKSDVQSIAKAYRVYMLVMPQLQITVAADRLASTSDLLTNFALKLQERITTSQTAGTDVTALQTLLTDMNAKIADAKVQAAAAIAKVTGLTPDSGDAAVQASNQFALKAAREDIRVGTQDIKAANKDANQIRVGLNVHVKANATSTASTTTE